MDNPFKTSKEDYTTFGSIAEYGTPISGNYHTPPEETMVFTPQDDIIDSQSPPNRNQNNIPGMTTYWFLLIPFIFLVILGMVFPIVSMQESADEKIDNAYTLNLILYAIYVFVMIVVFLVLITYVMSEPSHILKNNGVWNAFSGGNMDWYTSLAFGGVFALLIFGVLSMFLTIFLNVNDAVEDTPVNKQALQTYAWLTLAFQMASVFIGTMASFLLASFFLYGKQVKANT